MKAKVMSFIRSLKQKIRLPGLPARHWLEWLVLCALLVWIVWAVYPRGLGRVAIPYSTFVQQVRADNVGLVAFQSNHIRGVLKVPVVWPAASSGSNDQDRGRAATLTEFSTVLPEALSDPGLLPLLEEHGVTVVASPTASWLVAQLGWALPVLLLMALLAFMSREAVMRRGRARVLRSLQAGRHDAAHGRVTFADVIGQREAKAELGDTVEFLRSSVRFQQLRASIPRGTLLIGPSGTGKTLLVRAVSGEAGVPLFSFKPSDLARLAHALGANPIQELFRQAKQTAPAIVFVDDLDTLMTQRGPGLRSTYSGRRLLLDELLVQMDGLDQEHRVIVLAATSRPESLDSALLAPGRFRHPVYLSLPNRAERMEILRAQTRRMPLANDVDWEGITHRTPGLSGSDLASLCNKAALLAARRSRQAVSRADFDEALAELVLTGGVSTALLSEEQRRGAAYHEAGHAVLTLLLPGADPLRRVSVISQNHSMGLPDRISTTDRHRFTKTYLMTRLTVLLGGRTAEEMALGDTTTDVESDLDQATQLARRMVTRWGMSDLGPVSFRMGNEQAFPSGELTQSCECSEASAAQIDRSVRVLLEDRHAVARHLLKTNRPLLDQVAELLLREETVDAEQIPRTVGPVTRIVLPDKITIK